MIDKNVVPALSRNPLSPQLIIKRIVAQHRATTTAGGYGSRLKAGTTRINSRNSEQRSLPVIGRHRRRFGRARLSHWLRLLGLALLRRDRQGGVGGVIGRPGV